MAIKCTATRSTDGQPCQRWSIEGGSVCCSHGGSAPQVRNAAARRVSQLLHPAVEALHDALGQGGHIAVHAARVILWATIQHGWDDPDELLASDLDRMTPAELEHALASELAAALPIDRREVLAAIRVAGDTGESQVERERRYRAEQQADRTAWLLDHAPHRVIDVDPPRGVELDADPGELTDRISSPDPELGRPGDTSSATPWRPPADWRRRLRGEPPDDEQDSA